ncbi:EARP-interacting protein homolog isoform X2 [Watersipora subatra]|uniref:EARP-interacting protein homolog isoform X2 n=1 Tax=Watersipora subatra TaxID=2589382 RepID=UPI00355BDA32
MAETSSIIYGLETRARALSAQCANELEAIRFLVGTQSFRGTNGRGEDNQVHLIEYDEERHTIHKNIFTHSVGEVWQLAASPTNHLLLSTRYNSISNDGRTDMRACLWKLPFDNDDQELSDDSSAKDLIKVADLGSAEQGDAKYVMFSPNEEVDDVITLGDATFYLWDIEASSSAGARLKSHCDLEAKGHPKFTSARWDPHHRCMQIATTNDSCIRGWDLRSMKQTYSIDNAHGQLVRDLDFNPNRQYILATCGDDCRTKFWDVRSPNNCLKTLDDHSHWVWSVRFNHFHDQLLLTASSDSRVVLNSISSLSSEPFGKLVDELDEDDEEREVDADTERRTSRSEQALEDTVVQVFEEHEDSVYSVEWSSSDPWVFASLSYDGRVVVNHVPRSEKYKILL